MNPSDSESEQPPAVEDTPAGCSEKHESGVCPNCGEVIPAVQSLRQDVHELRTQVSELSEQVHRDTLTGLYNYRHFSEALDREMERTQRTGKATGLIMLDLDHFKQVNDAYGHEAGNKVLQHLAGILCCATRKLDIPCRYGGEEFAVILPSADLLTCSQVAERLRTLIEAQPVKTESASIAITASLGVDIYSVHRSQTQKEFVSHVDDLLYKAKRNGRNQICAGQRLELSSSDSRVNAEEKAAFRHLFSHRKDD